MNEKFSMTVNLEISFYIPGSDEQVISISRYITITNYDVILSSHHNFYF